MKFISVWKKQERWKPSTILVRRKAPRGTSVKPFPQLEFYGEVGGSRRTYKEPTQTCRVTWGLGTRRCEDFWEKLWRWQESLGLKSSWTHLHSNLSQWIGLKWKVFVFRLYRIRFALYHHTIWCRIESRFLPLEDSYHCRLALQGYRDIWIYL